MISVESQCSVDQDPIRKKLWILSKIKPSLDPVNCQ